MNAFIPPFLLSKEAHHGKKRPRPPPRPAPIQEIASIVPLDQLWKQLPSATRQELLGQLTRMVSQRLVSLQSKEAADE